MVTNRHRRIFLKQSAACAGGLVTAATLSTLAACARARGPLESQPAGYGELIPTEDQNGDPILALPRDFRYVTFGKIGERMTDGAATPIDPDGMGAFAGADGAVRLIRNHEVGKNERERGEPALGREWTRYDRNGVGGTVTIDFDPRCFGKPRRFVPVIRAFVSLNGTIVNCAGGYAFRNAGWFSCEETIFGPPQGWRQKHGYAFLVPASGDDAVLATPIRGMGRFKHEAAVADPLTGIVYQTEDAGPGAGSGFYRYLPVDPTDLPAGGSLQMLRVISESRADLREDRKNGARFGVDWVTIDDPDPDLENTAPGTFMQGFKKGGALFNRLEGIFRGEDGSIYFASTSGGGSKNGRIDADGFAEGYGQIWRYVPDPGRNKLVLIFESPGQGILDAPDNIVLTPRGGIICCEDSVRGSGGDTHSLAPDIVHVNRLIGLTQFGQAFEFAINRLNGTEFAGACFSPRGDILFVNIYGDGTSASGMTCAIIGPWARGPL